MDGIANLRGVSNWVYVQRNQFPRQGDDTNKVLVFKMSEVGPGSGVDLVRQMQPDRECVDDVRSREAGQRMDHHGRSCVRWDLSTGHDHFML
jgi:hypothetical protein